MVNFVTENSIDLGDLQAGKHRCDSAGHLLKSGPDLDRCVCYLAFELVEISDLAPGLCGLEFREYRFRSQFAALEFVFRSRSVIGDGVLGGLIEPPLYNLARVEFPLNST